MFCRGGGRIASTVERSGVAGVTVGRPSQFRGQIGPQRRQPMECAAHRAVTHAGATRYGSETEALLVQTSNHFHAYIPCRPAPPRVRTMIHEIMLLYQGMRILEGKEAKFLLGGAREAARR